MNGAPFAESVVEYHVLRRGQMLGPFSEEELRAGLADGRFEETDFVQTEGQKHWRPLKRVFGSEGYGMKGALAPDWNCILKWAWWRLRTHFYEQLGGMAIVCLSIGVLFLVLSKWPFVFWVPCFLLAALAGVILFRRERKVPAVLVLVGVIAVPWLFLHIGAKAVADKIPGLTPGMATEESASDAATVSAAPASAMDKEVAEAQPAAIPAAKPEAPAAPSLLDKATGLASSVVTLFNRGKAPASDTSNSSPASAPVPSEPPPALAPPMIASAPQDLTPPPPPKASPPIPSLAPAGPMKSTASSAPSTPSTAPADNKEEPPAFVPQNDALVIIKGSNGSGSGFLCRQGDKAWLFSNIHVISEVRQPVITRLDGVSIAPGTAELAAGRDIARLALTQPPRHVLEATVDFDNDVHIDDDVIVLGNKGGGGVVTELKGKVVGIGPDRLEVSAEFIPGNSGSPIIHLKTGKVIGIATYLTKRYEEFSSNPQGGPSGAMTNGKGEVVVRRYGYRIDKVPAWEPVNWAEMYAESDQMEQVSKLTEDIFDFLSALRSKKEPNFATDTLRRPAADWLSRVREGHPSESDRRTATQGFLNSLRFMVRIDVANLDGRMRYTYFRSKLSDETKVRDQLYQAFNTEFADISAPESRHSMSRKR